tara:strand:- start:3234 stop:3452 length:219 start_codon:yes stop_codon:yes gene_type:complete
MIHIDKYKVKSLGREWKNGKYTNKEKVTHTLTSEECITGKQFLSLIQELDDAWHSHDAKDICIEVTFKDRNN